jgi:hypothetical protein
VTLLRDVAEAPVFSTPGRTWTWSDVFLAARLWGEWEPVLDATRDAEASPAAVKQAGREWRIARRLIAGDELKAWLARRHVSAADWNAYLRRAIGTRGQDASPDPQALWTEGVCSGHWDDIAEHLCARAAASEAAGTPAARQPPPAAWFARMPSVDAALEIGVDPADVAARSDGLWAAETAFARLCAAAAASDAVAAAVASHNVDWLRVECDCVEATDEDVAREAALLARVDGLSLADVAQRAGLPLEPRRVYVGDLDVALQPTLMSAAPGDLVGPLALGNGGGSWLLAAVRAKLVPTLDDPDIRARAEGTAVAAAVRSTVEEQVTWHERG